MDIFNLSYANIPKLYGDIETDVLNILTKNNKTDIFEHSKTVAKTNGEIAKMFGLDKNICVISGYLHDISAIINTSDMFEYMMLKGCYIDEAEKKYPFLLHQRVSKLLAQKYFNINDERILSAIECHTTLKSNPSKYDMALFVADKLSWDQSGTPPFFDDVRCGLTISLEKASIAYIDYVIDNNMILHPHKWLIEAREYLNTICI